NKMSQNVPKSVTRRRIPIIIQGIIDGLSYEDIGKKCKPPVTRRQIYRDRQSIPFKDFFNDLIDGYMQDLKNLEHGGKVEKRMAFSHKGMLLRAMLKAVIPTRIQAEIIGTPPLVISFHKDTELIHPEEEKDADKPDP
ncbi:unnamed protein product, partial [marine sediment metagenome]